MKKKNRFIKFIKRNWDIVATYGSLVMALLIALMVCRGGGWGSLICVGAFYIWGTIIASILAIITVVRTIKNKTNKLRMLWVLIPVGYLIIYFITNVYF